MNFSHTNRDSRSIPRVGRGRKIDRSDPPGQREKLFL